MTNNPLPQEKIGFFRRIPFHPKTGLAIALLIFVALAGTWVIVMDSEKYFQLGKPTPKPPLTESEKQILEQEKIEEFAIKTEDFDSKNVIKFDEGGSISSDIISIKVGGGVTRAEAISLVTTVEARVVGEVPFDDFKYFHIKFQKAKTLAELEESVKKLRSIDKIKEISPYLLFESTSKLPDVDDINKYTSPGAYDEGKYAFQITRFVEAWERIREWDKDLRDVVIAVIDDAFDIAHEDLAANTLNNFNGYPARDFGDNDLDVSPDNNHAYHGTAVSGMAAGVINGIGTNGSAPTAKILPLKINTKDGGKANFDLAIRYATAARVDVINISQAAKISGILGVLVRTFNGIGSIEDAIRDATRKGVVVVAGVGNSGESADDYFPANMPEVIGVGGTDEGDGRWSGSNYSDKTSVLWVASPAKNMYVPVPKVVKPDGYGHDDGTSYSGPVVAGLAALLIQVGAPSSSVKSILRSTADDISVKYPDGSNHTWKRINAERAVKSVIGEANRFSLLPTICGNCSKTCGSGEQICSDGSIKTCNTQSCYSYSQSYYYAQGSYGPGYSYGQGYYYSQASYSSPNSINIVDIDGGEYSSIAIGSDGLPVIAYRNSTSLDLLIAKCTDAVCSDGTISTVDTSNIRWPSVTIGTDGNPIIAYQDTSTTSLKVAKCADLFCTSITSITSVTSSPNSLDNTISIDVRSDGIPSISYSDTGPELKTITCGNSSCSSGNTINTYSASGRWLSLAIGADDRAIVSSFSFLSGNLRVLKCATTSCATYSDFNDIDTDGPPGLFGAGVTSIAVGSSSIATTSYYDATNKNLKVARCGNAGCSSGNTVSVVDSSGDIGDYSSIKLASGDVPIISYYDATNGDLKFVKCGNTTCSSGNSIYSLDTTGNVGLYTSIAIPSDGLPIISYYDYTNDYLKVVKCGTPSCNP